MKRYAVACAVMLAWGVVQGQNDDAIARRAIISAITENDQGLHQSYLEVNNRPTAPGMIATADAIQYLYACTRKSREEFLYEQEILAANAKDKDWRNRVLLSLLTDEVYELNRLEGQNRFNKYTRLFNRVSTSLSQLVLLQPQAAASLLWDGMYGFKKEKIPTVRERKMVFLCDQFLKKFPNAPERNEVSALRQELKTKMLSERAKALSEAGRKAIGDGKFQLAEWHLEKAAILNPADAETSQLLAKAREFRVRVEEIRGLTLGVADVESRMEAPQRKAISDIARALITGRTQVLTEARTQVPYAWDSVDFAFAAMTEKNGDHDGALTRLEALAKGAPDSPSGRAAIKLLDNPNYNLNESFETALTEMNSDRNHFIWTGRRTKDDTMYAAGSTVISNAGNPVAVPILFGMDAAVRAVSEKFKTQIDVDGVIDAGARYLKKYPKTPRSKEISSQLAALSKKAGDYKRSREYLEESGGGTAEQVAKLDKNMAVEIYDKIKKSSSMVERRRLLDELEKDYPEADVTRKNAAKERAKLPPALANDTILLPADALRRDLRLAQYLGVPAYLLDKSKGNGELAREGVALTPSANASEYKIDKETTWRRAQLGEQGRDWILTAVSQLRQEYLSTEEGRSEFKQLNIPLAIDGSVGGDGGVQGGLKLVPYPTSQKDRDRFE